MPKQVIVSGGFEELNSRQFRFLEEAAQGGELTVLLWSDKQLKAQFGQAPQYPQDERQYFLGSNRYVRRVKLISAATDPDALPEVEGIQPGLWVVKRAEDNAAKRDFCAGKRMEYRVLEDTKLDGFPEPPPAPDPPGAPRKKVIVTGCYDWFHSGHVRFFEEVSAHGDLFVVVGHDDNIRMLKGEGHPMFSQEERRYLAGSIRFVRQALISTGEGWLDAEPEIDRIQPDIYAVNEDGDKGGKRAFCEQRGIEYLVLQRTPAPGLPRRTSTGLRGF